MVASKVMAGDVLVGLNNRAEGIADEGQIGLHSDVGETLRQPVWQFRRVADENAGGFADGEGGCHHAAQTRLEVFGRARIPVCEVVLQVGGADEENADAINARNAGSLVHCLASLDSPDRLRG